MNQIESLLREVASGGDMPDTERISRTLRHGSHNARQDAKKGIRIAAKKVRALVTGAADSDDLDGDVRELIETTATKFANLTTADPDAEMPRTAKQLADAVRERQAESGGDREKRLAKARAERDVRRPLVEILRGAGKGGGVDPRDLDALALRAGMTDEEKQRWRSKVDLAGQRVATIWKSGAQGNAMVAADKAAAELADALAPGAASHRDPHADTRDPRALADAVRGKSA
jgi:hypothetical protein